MRRLGGFVVRRRWWVLVGGLVVFVAAGFFGRGAVGDLSSGGFNEPGAESSRAAAMLRKRFPAGPPNVLLLVTATQGKVSDSEVVAAGQRLTRRLCPRCRRSEPAGEKEINALAEEYSVGTALRIPDAGLQMSSTGTSAAGVRVVGTALTAH